MGNKPFFIFNAIGEHPVIWAFVVISLWLANYAIRFLIHYNIKKTLGDQSNIPGTPESQRAEKLYTEVVQAGALTGILERTIVLILVLMGQFDAMAWVMAAKGFILQTASKQSDKPDPDALIKQETYLIGTFASFAIAILTGLLITNGYSGYGK